MGPRTRGTGRGPEGAAGNRLDSRSPEGMPAAHSAHTPQLPPVHTPQAGGRCAPHPWLDPGGLLPALSPGRGLGDEAAP